MTTKKLSECTKEQLQQFATLATEGYLEITVIDGERHYQLSEKGKKFFVKSKDKKEDKEEGKEDE
jgi:hypothetical protein